MYKLLLQLYCQFLSKCKVKTKYNNKICKAVGIKMELKIDFK